MPSPVLSERWPTSFRQRGRRTPTTTSATRVADRRFPASGVGSCWPRRRARRTRRSPRSSACNPVTVGKWRTRFAAKRLDGLIDEPRPGQPRKITDEIVEPVIVATLETHPPDGSTQWSTRSMAAKVGLNQTAVSTDLAHVRVEAASDRGLQAVDRPAVHRQGPRRRRALPEPARRGGRVVRRREDPGPSPRSDRAGAADAARHPGAPDLHLRPQRHLRPLRRARRGVRARCSPR